MSETIGKDGKERPRKQGKLPKLGSLQGKGELTETVSLQGKNTIAEQRDELEAGCQFDNLDILKGNVQIEQYPTAKTKDG